MRIGATVAREFVKAFLAVVFLAPLALEQALGLESAQERVKGALVDFDPERGEILAQGIAVMLAAQLGENGDNEQTAAQFETQIVKEVGV